MSRLVLSIKSLRYRKFTVGLTVVSIALSVALLLGVERIRHESRESFSSTVSGTDLIVGARTSPLQLMLSTVFRIGDPTNLIDWASFEEFSFNPMVAWTIPISLGDAHKGYRVLGTTDAYLEHFQYGRKQSLRLAQGEWFLSRSESVLGAEVARKLGYVPGDTFIVSHGTGDMSFVEHGDHPFTVTGILEPTGTPVDQTIHVSLAGINAIHEGMYAHEENLDPLAAALEAAHNHDHDHDHSACHELETGKISAFLIGLHDRSTVLTMQRFVNEYTNEPLTAALPALTLQQLWGMMRIVERTLIAISAFVVLVGLIGMLVAILTSLNERRREMAILRSVGARPRDILILILMESIGVTLAGIVLGMVILYSGILLLRPLFLAHFGIALELGLPAMTDWLLIGLIALAGALIGLIPGYRSYSRSLADGLIVKV